MVDLLLASDEVARLTAGIIKTEILNKKGEGMTYTLTARIQADPEEVNLLVEEVVIRVDKQKELVRLEQLNRDGQEMIERLRQEMTMVQKDRNRDQEELVCLEQLNRDSREKRQQLKEEMAASQNDKVAANRDDTQAAKVVAAWGTYEKGLEQMRQEEFAAVESFTKVIGVHPGSYNYLWPPSPT